MMLRAGFLAFAMSSTALVACSGQTTAPQASSEISTRVGATTADPRPTDSSSSTALVTTESEAIAELVGFTSPSGNIGCYLEPATVRCDVAERDWTPPPRPADCEFDYGQGIQMSVGEAPTFVCAGDTALGGGSPLEYGTSISAGPLRCESAEAGITCRDATTAHGFTIARDAFRLF